MKIYHPDHTNYRMRNKQRCWLTLRSCPEDNRVGVPAAVIDPGADVGPGVARHLLALDLQQDVLQYFTINYFQYLPVQWLSSLNRINEFYVSEF